ncbi:MAG: hypothetical protein AB7O45_08770 [Alphaproteobacteria bacterium]
MSNYMRMQSNALPAAPRAPSPAAPARLGAAIGALVLAWLGAIAILADRLAFASAPGAPPIAVLAAIAVPPMLFAAALAWHPGVRRQVLAIDPVWLAAVQGLRALGGGFLFVHAFGHLPGLFAWPAGLGDLLVAALAPFVAVRLARDPGWLASRELARFHALGLLDFAVAVGTGVAASGRIPLVVDGVTTGPLGVLPLVLIPAFAVPLWICLHLAAFAQIRAARRAT